MPYSGLLGPLAPDTFTTRMGRLRRGITDADPGMVAQPPVDPGYAMPNPNVNDLYQEPQWEPRSWVPVDDKQQQLLRALQVLTGQT